jgi:uncharacterized membrane protein
MKHYLILYIVTLVIMTILDLTWIGGIASDFYKKRINNIEFHALPAILFYVMYGVAVVIFVSGSANATWQSTLLYGALLGFFCYATYDLTNLATLKDWSLTMSLVDMAWGTCVTSVSATLGLLATGYVERLVS